MGRFQRRAKGLCGKTLPEAFGKLNVMTEEHPHPLSHMFEPRSIAVVGASPREGSVGNAMLNCVLKSGYDGDLHLINPRHEEIVGVPCIPDLGDLQIPPDLAILNVGSQRMETTLKQTIEAGARAAVIFDACHGVNKQGQAILGRVRDMVRDAGLPVCGGNGMGFFNLPGHCHASFYPGDHLKPGGISLIAHSGSVFTVLALNDPRYRFDLIVSPGQELSTSIDEYVTYALTRPTTRVIALFMEEARNPAGFAATLHKARQQGVPVVVCKAGRTEESARLAQSHSGAIAGSNAAYDAMLEACGAVIVRTVDQLMNVSMVLSQGRALPEGGLALVTDSGGLRETMIDRAASRKVPLAALSKATVKTLKDTLPSPLVPSNPQDCAGALVDDFEEVFADTIRVFSEAPEVAMIGLEVDIRDDFAYSSRLKDIALTLRGQTDKPCFVYSSFTQANNRKLGDVFADRGVPLINGADEVLSVAAILLRQRALLSTLSIDDPPAGVLDATIINQWRDRLSGSSWIGEALGLELIEDFGIPVTRSVAVSDEAAVIAGAASLRYPLVLKTAAQSIAHKSDRGGVVLNLKDALAVKNAYQTLAAALGPEALVQEMVPAGVELAFGCIVDPTFGPLVMVSAGGTLIDLMKDRQIALAPFGPRQALQMIEALGVAPLLDGVRGSAPVDKFAIAEALSRFSVLCEALKTEIREVDVNPVVAGPDGVIAVDALVVTAGA